METFLWLFLLSMTMFIGSFLAGSIPLAFHLSEDRLRTISAFGVGLLVGTALIVIIPEGIETIYSANSLKNDVFEGRNVWNNNHNDGFENLIQKRMMIGFEEISNH